VYGRLRATGAWLADDTPAGICDGIGLLILEGLIIRRMGHAEGHVALSDSYTTPSSTGQPWDYFHINSVSLDPWGDGNFIVSSRNTWAAYEISHHTGQILWRVGGKPPQLQDGGRHGHRVAAQRSLLHVARGQALHCGSMRG
jgi:hypothetical protein